MTRSAIAITALLLLADPSRAQDDVVNYSKHDTRMNAAMAKSQATLPEFDAAVARHVLRAILNVRVPYGNAGANEYLWLDDLHRNGDGSYDGIVTDHVLHVPDLRQGSHYHAARASVADWIFSDNQGDHGGWTVRVMREDMTAEQRAAEAFHFVD